MWRTENPCVSFSKKIFFMKENSANTFLAACKIMRYIARVFISIKISHFVHRAHID